MLWHTIQISLIVTMAFAISAANLSPRDAIKIDDLGRYDKFLSTLKETQFLDMYLENSRVKIDVFEYPSNKRITSEIFTPSSSARQYFDQEKKLAEKLPCVPPNSYDASSDPAEQQRLNIYPRAEGIIEDSGLEDLVSRCYQFCGTIANCRGNNGCPHCYAVRQGCLWQKWCR